MLSKISVITLLLVIITIMSTQAGSLEEEWSSFKSKHNRNYGAEEEPKRKEIFRQNLDKINEHNKKYEKGEVSFTMGVNQFSDLTQEEFSKRQGFRGGGTAAT